MPNKVPRSLHESELKDILTAIADMKDGTFFDRQNRSDRLNQSSIARASKDLVMSFPVLCEDTIDPSTASMICKAIERKAITMFQILFSANAMKASGGVELLKKWHNNVASDFNFIDNYMDAMDFLDDGKIFENTIEKVRNRRQITEATDAIKAENKRLGKVYLPSISEFSLNDYKVFNAETHLSVLEAKRTSDSGNSFQDKLKAAASGAGLGSAPESSGKNTNPDAKSGSRGKPPKREGEGKPASKITKGDKNKKNDKPKREPAPPRGTSSAGKGNVSSVRNVPGYGNMDKESINAILYQGKDGTEFFNKQLLDTDVKKANELVPSLMIVRFVVDDPDAKGVGAPQMVRQFVAGVKARLIPIDSYDLFGRIESKNRDKAGLVQFVRATTKEISFVKDYLLAIDQAKIDAIKTSKNKTNGIFKTLEKRATKSVFNRLIGKGNDAGCITTIAMSQTSVDYLKKEHNIKMDDPRVAMKIMDAYNLLCFVIVDESIEVARFLFDGDGLFEQVSFNSLERESGDGSYKKMINLLSKMNR